MEGDYLTAEGTTLGGDDGIAVAYMLAVLDDDTLKHPALECVITTDEEIGLLGAKALDTSVLKGTHMINMDSEEEGYLWISCAGGLSGTSRIPVEYQEMEGVVTEVLIDGLNGGHSGAEIDKNRANANKLMGLFLYELGQKTAYSIKDLSGGTKDNAITRSCKATLVLGEEDLAEAKITAEKLQKDLRTEYAGSDKGITISVTTGKEETVQALSMVSKEKVVFYLVHVPFGIEKMSGEIEGLVETSSNLGRGMGDWDLFESGRLGMIPTGIWAFNTFADACDFNWDICVEPGGTQKATHFFSNALVVNADSDKKEAAATWINWLASSDTAAQMRIDAGWDLPAINNEDVLSGYLKLTPPENRQAVFDSLNYLTVAPIIEDYSLMSDIITNKLSLAASGEITVKEALDQAQEECTAQIKLQ